MIDTVYHYIDQIAALNPVLIIILVPLMDRIVYRIVNKCYTLKPLRKISLGMLFTFASFILSAILQFFIEMYPNQVHVTLQIPQYILLGIAEVLVSVTALEFSYSQAPKSMKSVMQSVYLLTVAGGNIVVMVVALVDIIPKTVKFRQAYEFFFFSGLMLLVWVIFVIMSYFYKYKVHTDEEESTKTGELKEGDEVPLVQDTVAN